MTTERITLLTNACLLALPKLKPQEHCVLWRLVLTLPTIGEIISHAELGRELSITPPDITRVMKRLRELGLLCRGAKVGVSYHYKLNPAFFRFIS